MKKGQLNSALCILCFLAFGVQFAAIGQDGFRLPKGKKKDRISFNLVNNLAVIPVEINGKKLSFLLDTGVNSTLLFSLDSSDSLQIKNATPVTIRGLGEGGDIEALKSNQNKLQVGAAVDNNHEIYVIFDQNINFSPRMGVPVHGVLGFDFYKDFIVKTDYDSEIITIFDPNLYKPKRCRGCETFDITFVKNKPYIKNTVSAFGKEHEVTLLIDSGASDALWLFDEDFGITDTPKNYFSDFLGLGLSGGVYGKRSKVAEVSLGSFKFKDVNVAYPDSLSLRNLKVTGARNGTLGSDILRRFTVIMDYPSRKITLKKNAFFKMPFHYNMSGIIIEHSGMVPIKAVRSNNSESIRLDRNSDATGTVNIDVNPLFTFFLTPKFVVAELRKESPADDAGIRVGDEVLSINGKPFYKWKLAEINSFFSSKIGRKVVMQILRNGIKMKKRFTLKKVL